MPEIVYRADGGHPIGIGHVMRAIRLAEQWLRLCPAITVNLLTRDDPTVRTTLETSAPANMRTIWLPPRDSGILPVLDAADFEAALSELLPDIIIVDMLDTPAAEMRKLSEMARMIVSFDDRGDGRQFAHLVSNFLVRDPDSSHLDASRTWLREGPEYAPLGVDLAGVTRRKREPKNAQRVLVSLGGTDASGLAVKVARALSTLPAVKHVDFALGVAGRNYDEVKRIADAAPWQAKLHSQLPSLLPLYEHADIAIVAGGITMHEVARCGVPSIALCQPVDHQLLVAEHMETEGCMLNLGYGDDRSENLITAAVASLASDREQRQSMANAGPRVCDGLGARRLAELVLARWAVIASEAAQASSRGETAGENGLWQSKEFLRKLIDHLPCLVWVVDRNGRFVLVNRACGEFGGLDTSDLEGKTYRGQGFSDETAREIEADDRWVMETGRELQIPERAYISPKDGRSEWLATTKIPLFDESGDVEAMLGIAVFITQTKAAEDELRRTLTALEQAYEHQSVFLRNVTHEVRTPLTSTVGYSKILLEEICGPINDAQALMLQNILASSNHLLGIVDALLEVTRLKSGRIELTPVACNPVEIARTAVDSILPQARDKGIPVDVICNEDASTAYYDRQKLIVILTNLLSNAVKFTAKGGVKVYVSSANQHAEFIVVDTGNGIPQSGLPAIFDEFEQLSHPSKHKSAGFGLGLAVVEAFVHMTQSTLVVSSRHNEGTAITLRVPALDPDQHG